MLRGSVLPRGYQNEDRCRCLSSPLHSLAHGMATSLQPRCRLGQTHRLIPATSSACPFSASIVRLLGSCMARQSDPLSNGRSLCRYIINWDHVGISHRTWIPPFAPTETATVRMTYTEFQPGSTPISLSRVRALCHGFNSPPVPQPAMLVNVLRKERIRSIEGRRTI